MIFEEAAQLVVNDYRANGHRSLELLQARIRKHLRPVFAARKLASITTGDVRAYIAHRQGQGAAAATINRESAILRRAFVLAIQDGAVFARPHFPMMREAAPRSGFFDERQLHEVASRLPADVQPVATFAFITGWRIKSEVLALRWRQVDFEKGEVRLDPGQTKSREPRVFPFTDELRAVLIEQRERIRRVERHLGRVIPDVFVWTYSMRRCLPGSRIRDFRGSWQTACKAAGLPDRVPHDFRRSAIRNMVQRGIPERVSMALAGHKTATVFARYAIVAPADLTSAAGKLAGIAGTHGIR
jgi:integrase